MSHPECDIWFGPGGLKGVFGAGVAEELHYAIQRGEMDATKLRLFGSSVGCLTAAYLATGNAENGISLFQEDTDGLIKLSNLLPSLGARIANQIVRAVGNPKRDLPVPSVLNIDHALDVMMRRTPNILRELADAAMPTFAEYVDIRTGEFRHIDLQSAQHPLKVIRSSLSCFPLAWSPQAENLDSGIAGYGFVNLVRCGHRKLVIVLNSDLSPARIRESCAGIACAVLSARAPVSRLYLHRRRNRHLAVQSTKRCGDRVLVIAPEQCGRLNEASDFQRAHDEGRDAARKVIDFAQAPYFGESAPARKAT